MSIGYKVKTPVRYLVLDGKYYEVNNVYRLITVFFEPVKNIVYTATNKDYLKNLVVLFGYDCRYADAYLA